MFYELRGTIVSPNSQLKKWLGIAIGNDNAKAIQESENPERTMRELFLKYTDNCWFENGEYLESCELKEIE